MNDFLALTISANAYYILSAGLALIVLFGIFLMSKVETAKTGNALSGFAVLLGVLLSMVRYDLLPIWTIYLCLFIGTGIGAWLAVKVQMIQMPQMIALLNGLGGLASMIVGGFAMVGVGSDLTVFSQITAMIAVFIGGWTFIGSMIAAGKLHRVINQKPIVLQGHRMLLNLALALTVIVVVFAIFRLLTLPLTLTLLILLSFLFGLLFTIRIGGADMPIAISLLNSLSGVAGAISGLAIGDVLLVAIGGIVGASGLLLTQIMCRAMNRSLWDILLGKTTQKAVSSEKPAETKTPIATDEPVLPQKDFRDIVNGAKEIIIVPGYGMAVAQAQHLLKQVADCLKKKGARVRYAIHPVAGRMPGHMNVLLAEANVDYDELFEMDDLNDQFRSADLTIVVGANDVLNPAARAAEGTPIYGMPILNVDQCENIFIFNYDLKPGYAGVNNPLYEKKNGVHLFLGNAKETLQTFLSDIQTDH
ncbi:MAG TPA: NAD(P)(+) transhydrogenase (Re/Si-specific) subunit beta [Candidatus Izemoplasmatales bacterium]|nr:NAD(P)(+) transhydrogenase (Re/Si-specific) subunit beta [Candidatus Izemoplasmatales bacterium]